MKDPETNALLELKDRKKGLRTYKRSFIGARARLRDGREADGSAGSQFVDWVIATGIAVSRSRSEAIAIGTALLNTGIIEVLPSRFLSSLHASDARQCVTKEHGFVFQDKDVVYFMVTKDEDGMSLPLESECSAAHSSPQRRTRRRRRRGHRSSSPPLPRALRLPGSGSTSDGTTHSREKHYIFVEREREREERRETCLYCAGLELVSRSVQNQYETYIRWFASQRDSSLEEIMQREEPGAKTPRVYTALIEAVLRMNGPPRSLSLSLLALSVSLH
jgi:hypothetical protein